MKKILLLICSLNMIMQTTCSDRSPRPLPDQDDSVQTKIFIQRADTERTPITPIDQAALSAKQNNISEQIPSPSPSKTPTKNQIDQSQLVAKSNDPFQQIQSPSPVKTPNAKSLKDIDLKMELYNSTYPELSNYYKEAQEIALQTFNQAIIDVQDFIQKNDNEDKNQNFSFIDKHFRNKPEEFKQTQKTKLTNFIQKIIEKLKNAHKTVILIFNEKVRRKEVSLETKFLDIKDFFKHQLKILHQKTDTIKKDIEIEHENQINQILKYLPQA